MNPEQPNQPRQLSGSASRDIPGFSLAMPVSFKFYMFDWDDNVLHMPTPIYLEKKTSDGWVKFPVSTSTFAEIRRDTENYRPDGGTWDNAFRDFYDWGLRGDEVFLEDSREALRQIREGIRKPAPSFDRFKKALIQGSLFAIISARAHSGTKMRKVVELFIREVLSAAERHAMLTNLRMYIRLFEGSDADYTNGEVFGRYLNLCRFWGVSSPEFREFAGLTSASSESPERAKKIAISRFVKHVIGLVGPKGGEFPVSVGFSDDDPHNIMAAESHIRDELARKYPGVKFVVYDTSPDSDADGGRKIVIRRE